MAGAMVHARPFLYLATVPIYEYRCKKGHTFEVLQSIHDDPVKKCEVCGAPVERVLHPVAVHFKGSGFYNTDYGTKKRQRENKAAESKKKDKADASPPKPASTETKSSGGGGKDAA
jgi:putative FmdB family regulatory protein